MTYRLITLAVLGGCMALSSCANLFKPAKLPRAPAMPEMQMSGAADTGVDADWWTLFNDAELNRLMAQMEQGNLNVQLMAAKVRQAQAALASAQSSFLPSVSVGAAATRAKSAGGSAASAVSVTTPVSWELDVWGRLDALATAAKAGLQASREDLALASLSAQASLVQTYVAIRNAEQQQRVRKPLTSVRCN